MVKTGIVGGVGIVVIILASTLGWVAFPNIAANQAIVKSENEEVYSAWIQPPVPITIEFYLFSCDNCENRTITGGKPKLTQYGPFRFRETREKWEIVPEGGLLTYRENITYYYDPLEGDPDIDTAITSPNPIYFTLQSLIAFEERIPELYKDTLAVVVDNILKNVNEHPFMTRTAREMLFDGWSLENYHPIIEAINDATNLNLPLIDRFGYFYGRNGSNSGTFTIESGSNNLNEMGFIKAWNGNANLNYWNDSYCNMINGTDGAIFPPMQSTDPEHQLYLFTPDICRAIYMTYEKDDEYMGITGHRFAVPEIVFGNFTTNPDNLCYCYNKNESFCFKAGILDLRSCLFGAPMLLSSPHSYLGDQQYIDAIEGINPIKEEHETFLILEPITSIPIDAAKRIQFNIDVRSYRMKPARIPDIVFPVFWVSEAAGLDEKSAQDIKSLESTIKGVNIGRWCFLAAGIILFLASTVMFAVYTPLFKKHTIA